MPKEYGAVVIGSGFSGATAARELAQRGNRRVLVLEQRAHVGGNAYDQLDANGILVHAYGPHIFHTQSDRVFDYLSRFTSFTPYEHRVVGNVGGTLLPIPFNFAGLEGAFAPAVSARIKQKLLAKYEQGSKVSILALREEQDEDLRALAQYIFENIFFHYTKKQWGVAPDAVDAQVLSRVPILLSYDDRYFQDKYQGMPTKGYAALFNNMLKHPNIEVVLNCDAADRVALTEGKAFLDEREFLGPVIYTGAIDRLFSYCLGMLPYRTLDLEFETLDVAQYQTHATVNYTLDDVAFTRITEFKHMT